MVTFWDASVLESIIAWNGMTAIGNMSNSIAKNNAKHDARDSPTHEKTLAGQDDS